MGYQTEIGGKNEMEAGCKGKVVQTMVPHGVPCIMWPLLFGVALL